VMSFILISFLAALRALLVSDLLLLFFILFFFQK
jgi:hypothetical protein